MGGSISKDLKGTITGVSQNLTDDIKAGLNVINHGGDNITSIVKGFNSGIVTVVNNTVDKTELLFQDVEENLFETVQVLAEDIIKETEAIGNIIEEETRIVSDTYIATLKHGIALVDSQLDKTLDIVDKSVTNFSNQIFFSFGLGFILVGGTIYMFGDKLVDPVSKLITSVVKNGGLKLEI